MDESVSGYLEEEIMGKWLERFIVWLPRILAISFMAYLLLFSLDVFQQGAAGWDVFLGFIIHNIPTLILLGIVIASWRREWVGAVIFSLSALVYAVMLLVDKGFQGYLATWILGISGPALVVAGAYWLSWRRRQRTS